jgi:hypothetical protein
MRSFILAAALGIGALLFASAPAQAQVIYSPYSSSYGPRGLYDPRFGPSVGYYGFRGTVANPGYPYYPYDYWLYRQNLGRPYYISYYRYMPSFYNPNYFGRMYYFTTGPTYYGNWYYLPTY